MVMHRHIAALALGGLAAFWIVNAGVPEPGQPLVTDERVAVAEDPLVRDLLAQTARLRAHLESVPEAPAPARNPFEFGMRPAPGRAGRQPSASPEPPGSRALPQVLLRLSGIAEHAGAGGPVRTAILRTPGDLVLARVGDEVLSRYRIVAIGADAVELADMATGLPVTLALD
jgi:hypothetical protein